MNAKEKILQYLEQNARLTAKNIADALDLEESSVAAIISEAEADGTLRGYHALVDWDKTDREHTCAVIEIKVHIRHGEGFEEVAKQICAYDEVQDLYLMSGGYDLMVVLEGKSLRDVARFVGEKLAVIDGVTGTATHFVLTKYKDKGVMMDAGSDDHRILGLSEI